MPFSSVNARSCFLRLLGLILLASAFLKGYDAATGSFSDSDFWESPWFALTLSALELVFGWWLVLGLFPPITYWATSVCFLTLLDVSLFRALSGESSCGCFGRLVVNPWITSAFDGLAVLLLLLARAPVTRPISRRNIWARLTAFVVLSIGTICLGVWYTIGFRTTDLDGNGNVLDDGSVVALQPEIWTGRRLPLLKYLDIGARLEKGSWIVMLYHADCPSCKEAVPRYVGLAHELASQRSATRVALVEIPPYESELSPTAGPGSVCIRGRLTNAKHWRVRIPIFLKLKDGVVETASGSSEVILGEMLPSSENASSAGLFPNYRQIRRELFLKEIACGPLALITVLQDLGITLGEDEIEALLAEAGSQGIDLLRLKQLAEEKKLHALGVAVSPAQLRRIGCHAIVHLDGFGYAAVTEYVPDGLRVVYPLRRGGIVPDDLFEKAFGGTGYALLLSRQPLSANKLDLRPAQPEDDQPAGAHVRVSRSALSVGRIHGREWTASLTLANDGTKAVEIATVESSCPCMTASLDAMRLEPGQSTTLHAKGTQNFLGGFTYYLKLVTNQEQTPEILIPVRGYLEQPVGFAQPALFLHDYLPGQTTHVEVPVDVPTDINPRKLEVQVPDAAPVTANIRNQDDGTTILVLDWRGMEEPALYRYQIDVKAGDVPNAAASTFHFAVEVVPEVEIVPPSLLIREEELGAAWSRCVTAKFRRKLNGPGTVSSSDPSLAVMIETTHSGSTDTTLIHLSIKQRTVSAQTVPPEGHVQLSLSLQDGRSYKIPIYFGKAAMNQGDASGASREQKQGTKEAAEP